MGQLNLVDLLSSVGGLTEDAVSLDTVMDFYYSSSRTILEIDVTGDGNWDRSNIRSDQAQKTGGTPSLTLGITLIKCLNEF